MNCRPHAMSFVYQDIPNQLPLSRAVDDADGTMLLGDLTLRPSDVAELLASSMDPISGFEPLLEGSPEWQRSQSEGLSIDLGIRLFSNNELDGLFLESPTSLHLSPPAVSKRRRLSEDSLSHVFDDDVEPCAKRHRLSDATTCFGVPALDVSSTADFNALLPPGHSKPAWQGVKVQQVDSELQDSQLSIADFMSQFSSVQPSSSQNYVGPLQQSVQLPGPVLVAQPAATFVSESELMPGRFSQAGSPAKASVTSSPNKPTTPARKAVRSPFVTRPTRLAFSTAPAVASTAQQHQHQRPYKAAAAATSGSPPEEQLSIADQEAIRLAAAALQTCGSASAAISYLLQLGGAAACTS